MLEMLEPKALGDELRSPAPAAIRRSFKSDLVEVGVIALLVAIPAVVVAVLKPGQRAIVFDAYVLFLGALALLVLVRATLAAADPDRRPHGFRRWRRRAEPEPRLPELERIEREVVLAAGRAFDLHYRLRPLLRDAASGRLTRGHGVDLDRNPERARALLGDEAWELVRRDRPPPYDRHGPGLPIARIRGIVDAIEAL